ncbi:MAG TPA: M1 family aminopeptidase [Bryobacterales bacterium]|nr:M1 family aminopeptidase [Bryobacterales bacterium]
MLRVLLLMMALGLAQPMTAQTAADQLEAIRRLRLDPSQCFRVRDLFLEREDVKLYFTDGYVLFAEPFNGRTLAALFIASAATDEGEILVVPPSARERQSLVRFTSEPVLNEKFRTAMMFFTDDTAQVLRQAIEESEQARADLAAGEDLAGKWSRPVGNVLEGLSLRVLLDTFSGAPPESGFFAAAIGGGARGRFDVVIDPRNHEQVVMGQTIWREGRRFYETWVKFEGRNFRSGSRKPVPYQGRLDNFHIETHLSEDLSMRVALSADFLAEGASDRIYVFELSERLQIRKVMLDGAPAEFVEITRPSSSAAASHNNNIIAVVIPHQAAAAERRRIEFHYDGKVVTDAGNGVYYVGSRDSWYPRREIPFAAFELTFHYPESLDLVATGELLATESSAGVRTSKFRTRSPIRLAGFNLGSYERAHREIGEYRVEVCANKTVEENLQPKAGPPIVWSPNPIGLGGRRGSRGSPGAIITTAPRTPPPSPVSRLDYVASDSAEAFSFFLDKFGPPSTRTIVISPIPGNLGQGLPGLVYASTLSYFKPDDLPLRNSSQQEQLFYSELLRTHEISHQWWGNVIGTDSSQDEWIMEALATYSSLLFLEQRRGRASLDRTLGWYKDDLLARNDGGETNESAGAIVLGDRLRSSLAPEAARIIVYEKGAWIIHMLRGMMGDEKFFSFLRSLCDQFRLRSMTTEDFRAAAAGFVSNSGSAARLDSFFEQWVYGTGIPTIRLDYAVTKSGKGFQVKGRLHQEGVPESFSLAVPLGIQTAVGGKPLHEVTTSGGVTEFTFSVPDKPTGVSVDPANLLLINR